MIEITSYFIRDFRAKFSEISGNTSNAFSQSTQRYSVSSQLPPKLIFIEYLMLPDSNLFNGCIHVCAVRVHVARSTTCISIRAMT